MDPACRRVLRAVNVQHEHVHLGQVDVHLLEDLFERADRHRDGRPGLADVRDECIRPPPQPEHGVRCAVVAVAVERCVALSRGADEGVNRHVLRTRHTDDHGSRAAARIDFRRETEGP